MSAPRGAAFAAILATFMLGSGAALAAEDATEPPPRPRHRFRWNIAPEIKLTSFSSDASLLTGATLSGGLTSGARLGLGGYGLVTSHSPVAELGSDTGPSRIAFGYGGVYVGKGLRAHPRLRFTFGALVGAGGVTVMTRHNGYAPGADPAWRAHHGGAVAVAEPLVDAELRLHRSVRLAIVGSYRLVSSADGPGLGWRDLSGPAMGTALRIGWF